MRSAGNVVIVRIGLLIVSVQVIVAFWLQYESDYGVIQFWATGALALLTSYSAVRALLFGVEA